MQNLTPVKEASQKSGLPWLELPEVIVPETAAQDSHVDVRWVNSRFNNSLTDLGSIFIL